MTGPLTWLVGTLADPRIDEHLLTDEGEQVIDEVRHHPVVYVAPVLEFLVMIAVLIATVIAFVVARQIKRAVGVILGRLALLGDHDTKDLRDALEALVCEHLALVRSIARRFGRDADQRDDLVQEGVVGLLKAIRRFDPGRDVPFPAYAIMAVTGEIRHHLRDRSSCVRAPEATTAEVIPLDDDVPTTASDFGRSEDRMGM